MTTDPSFAEMKGRAVLLMNYLQENRTDAGGVPFQWPIETGHVLSLPALVVNGTSALVWRRNVPANLLRKEDRAVPWTDDDWAFLSMTRVDEEERDERQRLVYPGVIERWRVVEIFADWQSAVHGVVMNALCHAVTEPLLEGVRKKTEPPAKDDH
jgi:hypothetical protein